MSAIQADTYIKESTNTGARPLSASTCGRLHMLDLLPLSLDRELKDLNFFYKCRYCSIDLDVLNYVSFVSHGRTRLSNSFYLRTPFCKTSFFRPRTLTE